MVELSADRVTAVDSATVWHPYSAFPQPGHSADWAPPVVESAAGVRLRLAGYGEVVDAMSSWWAAIHGYRHPVLDAAAHAQVDKFSHVMFGGLTHAPAAALAELLVDITPAPLTTVFFADSGSVSVEVAVKMALQYWRARGDFRKSKLLTWRGGYHGDTFTPMSVCDPDTGMHTLWTDVLAEQIFVAPPPVEYDAQYSAAVDAAIAAHAAELAAVIVEPVVQGAGGMRFHDPRTVAALRASCDRHGVLLICDEIATGFGRAGTLFAVDAAGIAPDIMCLGKALTGGYVTLAATLCTAEVAATISAAGVLAHGPTFMANPLACAIAHASTTLLLQQDWATAVSRIEQRLTAGLEPVREAAGVREVRVRGAIGVIEMTAPVDLPRATAAALQAGVWLRPFGKLLYTMPPYISTDADIDQICAGLAAAVAAGSAA